MLVEECKVIDEVRDIKIDFVFLERMFCWVCNDFIKFELDFIWWDIIMGDGDCGLIFEIGVKVLLEVIDGLYKIVVKGLVIEVFIEFEEIFEGKMGGIFGGILGIFFVLMRIVL